VKGHAINRTKLPVSLRSISSKEAASPVPVIVVGPGRDKRQFLPYPGTQGGIAAKFHSVFLWSEISTASPGLVANSPVMHVEGLRISARGSHLRQGSAACRRVAVFHPTIEILGGKTAYVGSEVGLGSTSLQNWTNSLVPNRLGSYL